MGPHAWQGPHPSLRPLGQSRCRTPVEDTADQSRTQAHHIDATVTAAGLQAQELRASRGFSPRHSRWAHSGHHGRAPALHGVAGCAVTRRRRPPAARTLPRLLRIFPAPFRPRSTDRRVSRRDRAADREIRRLPLGTHLDCRFVQGGCDADACTPASATSPLRTGRSRPAPSLRDESPVAAVRELLLEFPWLEHQRLARDSAPWRGHRRSATASARHQPRTRHR
jgi:hypothetical protein